MTFKNNWAGLGAVALVAMTLAACSSTSLNRAPVEDRGGRQQGQVRQPVAAVPVPAGHYAVRPGDTLIRIGLEHGQSWKDIAAWNNLANADVIEVGQVLRVTPPGSTPSASASNNSGVVVQPVPSPASTSDAKPDATPATQPVTTVDATTAPATTAAGAPAASANTSGLDFVWPASGPLISGFNEATNKGYDIGGNAGDPVYAAAGGRVVYAGAGLRGYGNLIILKHNDQYLTAYAHNRTLLVKEDQTVTKGQKIAEMGNTDADRVKLHFEVRKQGKPVNPGTYLPRR